MVALGERLAKNSPAADDVGVLRADFSVTAGEQVVGDLFGLELPDLHTHIGWLTPNFCLDAIEIGNPFYGFFGDRRSLRFVHIDELALDMERAFAIMES